MHDCFFFHASNVRMILLTSPSWLTFYSSESRDGQNWRRTVSFTFSVPEFSNTRWALKIDDCYQPSQSVSHGIGIK